MLFIEDMWVNAITAQARTADRRKSMFVLLGTAVAFALMIYLIKRRVPLGLSLVAGGAAVGLAGFHNLQSWADTAYFALFSRSTLELASIILLINLLGCAMGAYGSLDRLNTVMGRIFPDNRYLLAFFPAAIGMLNVPGGAMLSAPLVEKAGAGIGLSQEQKAAANLIYRHFWFFIYPFYTSLIVINRLSGVEAMSIIKLGVLPTLVGFFSGWIFCFRGWRPGAEVEKGLSRGRDILQLAYNLSPIMISLVAVLVLHINFIYAILIGVVWLEAICGTPAGEGETAAAYLKKRVRRFITLALAPSLKWQLAIIPVGINFFRSALTSTGASKYLAELLLGLSIPVEALVFIIPLLISITTGLHLASVTISVPLFLPMLGHQSLVQPMFLLLTGATVGYWMSPLHLCLILTREYFGASYAGMIRIMFWPTLLVALSGLSVYMMVR